MPAISVVIASNRERALLSACVASLRPQCQRTGAELLVARAGTPSELTALAASMPGVRFIAAGPDASIPQLRGLGMSEATGDVVALTEDHCVADEHWLERILENIDGVDVLGGGMDNAQRSRAVDWGAYFAEYGFFATTRAPENTGEQPLLTGANVAYKRHIVDTVVDWAKKGEWENVAHDRLIAKGSVMRFISTAAVYQNRQYQFADFCTDRFEHGRAYARRRLAENPAQSRWVMLAMTPALPFLLTLRVAKAAASTRWGTFLRALPATFAFLTMWSVGEAAGYLRGPAAPVVADA